MNHRDTWDLSTIPDDALKSEIAKRTAAMRKKRSGGRKPSCECGKCPTCKRREQMRRWRKGKEK